MATLIGVAIGCIAGGAGCFAAGMGTALITQFVICSIGGM